MKKLSLLILSAALLAAASLFYVETSRAQTEPEAARLFDLIGAEKSVREGTIQTPVSPAEVREREIRVNFADLTSSAAKELSFQLLDGKSYTAVRSESEGFDAFADGGTVWRGKINGPEGWSGDVTLSVKGQAMSGLIYSPDAVYEIVPQGDFRHLLVELDQNLFPACAGALPQRPASETEETEADARKAAAAGTAAADDGSLIDVLVVYTSNVRSALGGTTQAQTFAQQSINSTNTAYINSGITPRVRLVGTMEASYSEAGTLDAALKWVDDNAAVAAARNSVNADMVALIVENASDGCGLAYVMRSVGSGFSGSAFSATARGCAVGNLSFAHELGHNEGCEHNPENSAPASSASYPYAFGHYVDGSFRTVMSYENPCLFGCTRVAYFSNPSVTFNGLPTGITNQRDNRRVINNTALTISQFRDSGGGGGTGGGPANNNFASAQVISGNSGATSGSNASATKETGEPNHAGNSGGASVWFQWQAPATGTATFNTAGSGFDTLLGVYTGSNVGALTLIGSNDDVSGSLTSSVVFNATAGTTYRIAVDGFGGATGGLTLNWNNVPPSPANDNFASAQLISGSIGTVLGTNAAATKEVGEPSHGGNSGGSSVWYRWQAPSSGSVTITTAGSGFDTLLGVYTGSSVGALTFIAGNDDDLTLGSLTSRVTFNAVGGTTYRIAVDGYLNTTGSIALNWNLTQSCSFSISPQGQSFTPAAGSGSVGVTATAGCSWTAVSNASFITITSAPGGTGNGTLSFSVAANSGTSPRSGTITVAGQTFTASQGANIASSVLLSASTYGVNESARKVLVGVMRVGDTSSAAAVSYATADGTASRLRDYTQTLGTLVFAPGETSKTVTVFVTNDVFVEPAETFTFTLSGPTLGSPHSAIVTITSDDATTGANPVGDTAFNADFFVRQHYVDFLNREADASGLAHWTNEITSCGSNIPCRDVRRINTSGAFFQSIEFQETGYLVYRLYKSAYGDATSTGVAGTVPVVRLGEFLPDTQRIGQGVVVGALGWPVQLEANKQAFALEFVQRPRFLAAFPLSMTPAQFVDKLRLNTGSALTQAERDLLVLELAANNTTSGRASVLRKVAEDATLQANETNRAFVLMQYFGYLRRNPDDAPDSNFAGWKFWLDKLNQFGGNYVEAEMVNAFITSAEYRGRFGP
jgi:hypothetical protein